MPFYKDQGQPTKAEEYFLKDIEIREKLAAENPERYNSDLAVSYYNMGLFYSNSAKKKCKMYKKKALALAKTCTHDPLCRKIIEVLGE